MGYELAQITERAAVLAWLIGGSRFRELFRFTLAFHMYLIYCYDSSERHNVGRYQGQRDNTYDVASGFWRLKWWDVMVGVTGWLHVPRYCKEVQYLLYRNALRLMLLRRRR